MLGLIHALTYSFSAIDGLLVFYFILFRSQVEYALPAWNFTTANANKLDCAKWKFAALSLSNFFLLFLTFMLLHLICCSYTLYKWQGITLCSFILLFMFFQDLNNVLPWLIILVSKFFLVIVEISSSFLQGIKIDLPLDAVNLVCSDIDILCNQIRYLTHSLWQ